MIPLHRRRSVLWVKGERWRVKGKGKLRVKGRTQSSFPLAPPLIRRILAFFGRRSRPVPHLAVHHPASSRVVMVIGVCEIRLSMPGNRSLKEKRMILKSIKDRIHNRFNVSIAEVGDQEKWCRARLTAAVVAGSGAHAHKVLEAVVRQVEFRGDTVLLDYSIQML